MYRKEYCKIEIENQFNKKMRRLIVLKSVRVILRDLLHLRVAERRKIVAPVKPETYIQKSTLNSVEMITKSKTSSS